MGDSDWISQKMKEYFHLTSCSNELVFVFDNIPAGVEESRVKLSSIASRVDERKILPPLADAHMYEFMRPRPLFLWQVSMS
jgi:hypothetical protein